MTPLLQSIAEGWSWKLGTPVEVIATNRFGNAIVRNHEGRYFRIMPEEWQCDLIAESAAALEEKRKSPDFIRDWDMTRIVTVAEKALGPLSDGRCYYLVTPGVVGGKYTADNMRTISLIEVLSYSGSMARQLEGLPDGAKVQIVIQKGAGPTSPSSQCR